MMLIYPLLAALSSPPDGSAYSRDGHDRCKISNLEFTKSPSVVPNSDVKDEGLRFQNSFSVVISSQAVKMKSNIRDVNPVNLGVTLRNDKLIQFGFNYRGDSVDNIKLLSHYMCSGTDNTKDRLPHKLAISKSLEYEVTAIDLTTDPRGVNSVSYVAKVNNNGSYAYKVCVSKRKKDGFIRINPLNDKVLLESQSPIIFAAMSPSLHNRTIVVFYDQGEGRLSFSMFSYDG